MNTGARQIDRERWQQAGRALAACEVNTGFEPRTAASLLPLRERLQAADATIRTAAREFVLAEPSPVREWLLDNEALLRLHLRDARESLDGKLRPVLPRMLSGAMQGEPQVLALAAAVLAVAGGEELQQESLLAAVQALQEARPLRHVELVNLWPVCRVLLLEQVAAALTGGGEIALSRAITRLRELGRWRWEEIGAECWQPAAVLATDPAGAYSRMDEDSRALYGSVIVALAHRGRLAEAAVAAAAITLARRRAADGYSGREAHVGYYLIDRGLPLLRRELGLRLQGWEALAETLQSHPTFFQLASIFGLTVAGAGGCTVLLAGDLSWPWQVLAALLLLLPVSETAVQLVNQLVTRLLPADRLSRLDFSAGIPAACRTLVAVPTLLTSRKNVTTLLEDLEARYLANRDPHLLFALLTDLPDAAQESDERDELVAFAVRGIRILNERYAERGHGPFYLFHRPRAWNESEGVWMGWERKRGKLLDLNAYLLGRGDAFSVKEGALAHLRPVKYVLTLDSDTQLPLGTARLLAGTAAHPLNQPVHDPRTGTVVAGYGILQPRVSISVQSAAKSWLARIYSGQTGLDPYTKAVSDVYQDLHGEGIYTGKGIYDVESFEHALEGRFPHNTLLSHDLVEGAHARCGLATHVELVDDYPSHYIAYCKRKHRWVRGDWQLLWWLLPQVPRADGTRERNPLSVISRWKILDNLRRSLFEVSLFVAWVAGWFVLPVNDVAWTAALAGLLIAPVLTQAALAWTRPPQHRNLRPWLRDWWYGVTSGIVQSLVVVTFLAHQAMLLVDAILRTLVRRFLTRRRLLEWESAAQAEAAGTALAHPLTSYLWLSPVLAMLFWSQIVERHADAVWAALQPLVLWYLAPGVALWLNSPVLTGVWSCTPEARAALRGMALRTWTWFARHSDEACHWLIPDHHEQGQPQPANWSSPTNLGMLLNARLAAVDLGYLSPAALAGQTAQTLRSIERLPHYRGHLLNWFDVHTLQGLAPRFVSTVDSGNYAAALLTLKQGCRQGLRETVLHTRQLAGALDYVAVLEEELQGGDATEIEWLMRGLRSPLRGDAADLAAWRSLLDEAVRSSEGLAERVERIVAGRPQFERERARRWCAGLQRHIQTWQEEALALLPWLRPEFSTVMCREAHLLPDRELAVMLQTTPTFAQLPQRLHGLQRRLELLVTHPQATERQRAAAVALWPELLPAETRARQVAAGLEECARRAEALCAAMDFRFLFDESRQLLRIGYDVDGARLDESCYDLLASEARMACFVAIAKGDIPPEAWFRLGRRLVRWRGNNALSSWSGTMFEYLMPALYMRSYPGTLLHGSMHSIVALQRRYAQENEIPWGISEAAYAERDNGGRFRYKACGVPPCGMKRGLDEDLVVAPYATLLALPFDPQRAFENLENLQQLGMLGELGWYESVDFTPGRLPRGQDHVRVPIHMAHHQGMGLLALANFLEHGAMQNRFHADPLVIAAELLLQERIPGLFFAKPAKEEGLTEQAP